MCPDSFNLLLFIWCGVFLCFSHAVVGIDRSTIDPDGGIIDRDADREPTGLLFDAAHDLIDPLLAPTVEEAADFIGEAVQTLLRHGVTSAHACEDRTWSSFRNLANQGRLPIRIFYSAYYDSYKKILQFFF